MRRVAIRFVLLMSTATLLGFTVLCAYRGPSRAPAAVLLLRPGIGARGVAAELVTQGVLRHPRVFLLFARITQVDRHLRAGRYAIPPNPSIKALLDLLLAGPNVRERITIPEGTRDWQIAGLLARAADVDSAAFLAMARDAASAARFRVPGPTLEGYLFPETYELPWGISGEEAASMLVGQYRKEMTREFLARAESLGLAEREVVTLASIIEAETALPEERARISAVYLNRLRAGWNLEADPTVRYATGNAVREISAEDLNSNSAYNTYRHPGLPPGPIGNPGRASLFAALNPAAGCPDFFFVANGDGGHTFSRTADEHARATAAFRRRSLDRASPPALLDTSKRQEIDSKPEIPN